MEYRTSTGKGHLYPIGELFYFPFPGSEIWFFTMRRPMDLGFLGCTPRAGARERAVLGSLVKIALSWYGTGEWEVARLPFDAGGLREA